MGTRGRRGGQLMGLLALLVLLVVVLGLGWGSFLDLFLGGIFLNLFMPLLSFYFLDGGNSLGLMPI